MKSKERKYKIRGYDLSLAAGVFYFVTLGFPKVALSFLEKAMALVLLLSILYNIWLDHKTFSTWSGMEKAIGILVFCASLILLMCTNRFLFIH